MKVDRVASTEGYQNDILIVIPIKREIKGIVVLKSKHMQSEEVYILKILKSQNLFKTIKW